MFDIFEKLLIDIGASGTDLILLIIMGVALEVRRRDLKKIEALRAKYELLNTLASNHAWIIRLKLGVSTIKNHRAGDVEIINPINDLDE